MKTINYTGNSKLIARIVHLLNRKAPLPLNGDGDAEWGTSGQVLTTDGQGNTSWTDKGGGGGGSTVSYTQTLASGTKTGEIEIDGVSTNMYAPTPPTKTSDLTNDSGFITSADVPTKTSDLTNDSGFITSADVPTKTSDLTNDSGFITNLVNNLANYYTKSQTYTQAEVDALISGIVTLNILVVQALPTQDISTTTIYLVPKQDTGTSDIYDEYLYINNAWELIGTTQIDLSNYVTTTDLSTALADYVTSVGLATILAGYVQSSDLGNGTLTIQQNGTTLGTFTANQSENTTVNLTGGGSAYTEGDGIDITNDEISVDTTFTEASTRANIASGESFATILGKIKKFFTDLKAVAFTGAYSDLTGQPTIPTVNNGTLTIQKNGTNVQTFSANQSGNVTANITVPTNTNELTNGAGFITSSGSCASATKATQDGSGNIITSTYVKKSGDTMTGKLTISDGGLSVSGRPYGAGDDEGIVITPLSNGYAGVCLGNPSGRRSVFYLNNGNDAFWRYNNGSASYDILHPKKAGTIAVTSDIPDITTKVSKSGDTMTGALELKTENSVCLNLRPGNASWFDTVSVQTGGNEAVVFASKNAATSWMFVSGEDSVTNHESARWQSLTPALQIKNGCVAIGKLIANNVTPTYALDVKGQTYIDGNLTISSAKQLQFVDSTVYIARDGQWLHIKSDKGIYYRSSSYHNFRNADNSAFATIFVGGATLFNGSDSASTWSCDANEAVISENRGNGFCVRADSGLWVRPTGTGTSFKPVAASAFNVNSSIRYKENIQPLSEEEARKILEVEAVTYDYKDKENSDDRSVLNQRGVIAEQVEEIIPSVVTLEKVDGEDVPGYVDYSKFVPYLIKMVQIQQKEIDELKAIVKVTE